MTEAEWNACTNPGRMLQFLEGKASDRKLRLFAVACCSRILSYVSDRRAKHILKVAERLADGLATNAERRVAAVGINDRQLGGTAASAAWGAVCCSVAVSATHAAVRCSEGSARAFGFASTTIRYKPTSSNNAAYFAAVSTGTGQEATAQPLLLRDIFGPLPFRAVAFDSAWLTLAVKQRAEGIYEEKAFDRMPFLGDVLEDAGCDNADILNHCRSGGEHVRGCWVVDLLLGKS